MKEYRIVEVRKRNLEKTINEMSKEGWDFAGMSYWSYWRIRLVVVFVREVQPAVEGGV
jgi:hypothetical protein